MLLLGLANLATAASRFVATTGNDSAPGTIEAPWRTLFSSFGRLGPGDTLYVRGGRYLEANLQFLASGTPSSPIVVRSYPGERAIVDPTFTGYRTAGNVLWAPVDSTTGEYVTRASVGQGVVRAWVAGLPGYENRRMALIPYEWQNEANFRSTNDEYDSTAFYAGPGTMEPNNRVHVRLTKTTELRDMEQRYGTVFHEEAPIPPDYPIVVAAMTTALRVTGSHLVFLDLEFDPAYETIRLDGHHLRFEGCTVWIGRDGFRVMPRSIEPGAEGVHHVTITRSRIYGDMPPWVFMSDQDSDIPPSPAEELRNSSIRLGHGTHDWDISYNHFRGSAQFLIEIRQDPFNSEIEHNIAIHHNRMENSGEDAMRFEGSVALGRIEIYENFVSNCFRFVGAGKFTPDFQGPLLIYRNVVSLLRDPAVNRQQGLFTWNGGWRRGYEYMIRLSGAGFTTQNTHIYHNTFVLLNSASKGINLLPQNAADGRFANNLLVTVNGRVNGDYTADASSFIDGSLYWKMNTVDTERLMGSFDTAPALFASSGFEERGLGAVPKRGTDPELLDLALAIDDETANRWSLSAESERRQPWNFTLGPGSPARGAAVAMPPHPVLGALPDTRASLDIGALPYGTSAADFDFFPFDPTPNQAPLVFAGVDEFVTLPDGATLSGVVTDDGNPRDETLLARWSMVSGPARVTMANPYALETAVTFSQGGTYTFLLSASDGEKTRTDQSTVVVEAPFLIFETHIAATADDAEERIANGAVQIGDVDLDLGSDNGWPLIVGLRFGDLQLPRGAEVVRASMRFTAEDGGASAAGPAAFELRGEAAVDASSFTTTTGDLSSRPKTDAVVAWAPPQWQTRWALHETPNLAEIIQEIVDRPGWNPGQAMAFYVTGTGKRSATSFNDAPFAAVQLRVEYLPAGQVAVGEPDRLALRAWVAPNPVFGSGRLHFVTPRSGPAQVELFDVAGRRVRALFESKALEAGTHAVPIGARLNPGVYFYRVRTADQSVHGRFLLLD